jgi:hypothetical protein
LSCGTKLCPLPDDSVPWNGVVSCECYRSASRLPSRSTPADLVLSPDPERLSGGALCSRSVLGGECREGWGFIGGLSLGATWVESTEDIMLHKYTPEL